MLGEPVDKDNIGVVFFETFPAEILVGASGLSQGCGDPTSYSEWDDVESEEET